MPANMPLRLRYRGWDIYLTMGGWAAKKGTLFPKFCVPELHGRGRPGIVQMIDKVEDGYSVLPRTMGYLWHSATNT